MESISFSSPRYRVIKILRKSNARYAKGVKVGDILTFSTEIGRTTGASSGNYALGVSIAVNGEYLALCSQNEFLILFEEKKDCWSKDPIFELLEEI